MAEKESNGSATLIIHFSCSFYNISDFLKTILKALQKDLFEKKQISFINCKLH